ncbi:hypothetical protein [Bacillus alkalicellulosilyticus]|uniref:hypothetical protein n=1 Tax=Alkalihalobacterium alkalicellulosilyticum TaxID=1912214 RepID=UPI000996F675|nr:hypothetical protein [Bacillus alkalicellulosilyticus]
MSIVWVVLFIGFVLLLGLGFTHKIIPFQAVRWVLVGYFGILSISYVASFFVPEEQVLSKDLLFTVEQQTDDYFSFYELVKEGKLEETELIEIVEEWSFPYEETELSLMDSHIQIMIERKPETDGEIEVTHYKTKSILDGKIEPSSLIISQEDTTFYFYEEKKPGFANEVTIALYGRDFVISQFVDVEKIDLFGQYRFNDIIWDNLIYIKIPKNVELDEHSQYYLINDE